MTSKQYGVRIDAKLDQLLIEEAKKKYSNPAATLRKCAALVLPCLANGIPEAAFEAMAGRKGRR